MRQGPQLQLAKSISENMETEFYVGYFDKAPKEITKFIRLVIVTLALTVLGIAWLLSSQQRGFIPSSYEYYQETELSGLLIADPVPAIQVYSERAGDQTLQVQTIPVVQFGKKGARDLVQELNGSWVTVIGHLIYYDGKTLIEITDATNLVASGPVPADFPSQGPITFGDKRRFKGEIVDAKCFFGVMKPGHGKPHRSCAIRCISGGIPAVLRTWNSFDNPTYHLIIMESNSLEKLSDYIGESVEIEGIEGDFYDWKVLKVNDLSLIKPVTMGTIEQ